MRPACDRPQQQTAATKRMRGERGQRECANDQQGVILLSIGIDPPHPIDIHNVKQSLRARETMSSHQIDEPHAAQYDISFGSLRHLRRTQ